VDTIATILSLGSVLLAFIELEDNYSDDGKDRNVSSPQGHAMRAGISIATFFLVIFVGKHHYFSYKIARERQTTSEGVGSTFVKSSSFRWMLFEVAYCAIHCPPGIDIEFTFEQLDGTLILSLDAICCCIMLLRIYILGRVVKHYNKFANDHAD